MNEQLDIEIEALKKERDELARKLSHMRGELKRERARTKDLEAQLAAVRPEVKAFGDAVLDAMVLGVSFIRIAPEDVFAKPPKSEAASPSPVLRDAVIEDETTVEKVARAIQDAHAPGHPLNHVALYQARAAIRALASTGDRT